MIITITERLVKKKVWYSLRIRKKIERQQERKYKTLHGQFYDKRMMKQEKKDGCG